MRKVSYEVLVSLDGRWVIDSVHQDRTFAVERAEALAGGSDFDGVRVTEERVGRRDPEVVFEAACDRREKPMAIVPIEEAPLCAGIDDLYGFPARRGLGRLLRRHFDKEGLTPLEFLHDFSQLRAFQRNEALLLQAMRRVAAVQARADGSAPEDRLDFLEKAIPEVVERARRLPDLRDRAALAASKGLAAATEGLDAATALAMAGRFLGLEKDWPAKFSLVLAEAGRHAAAPAPLLDEMAAEILDGAMALREILGSRADLGGALIALAETAGGRLMEPASSDNLLARLNGLLAAGGWPLTREVLLGHVQGRLAGITPLTREGEAADLAALKRLLGVLAAGDGWLSRPALAEAVTVRMRMAGGLNGENLSAGDGIDRVLDELGSSDIRVQYLSGLADSGFGEQYPDEVARRLMGGAPKEAVAEGADVRRGGMQRRNFPKGTIIFRQGEVGDEAYLVAAGTVEIYITKGGRSLTLGVVGRGGILGEMSLIDDQPRMATARAATDVELGVLPRDLFRRRLTRLAESDPVIRRLLDVFVQRLRSRARLAWHE